MVNRDVIYKHSASIVNGKKKKINKCKFEGLHVKTSWECYITRGNAWKWLKGITYIPLSEIPRLNILCLEKPKPADWGSLFPRLSRFHDVEITLYLLN